jgi:hypothetical protein
LDVLNERNGAEFRLGGDNFPISCRNGVVSSRAWGERRSSIEG